MKKLSLFFLLMVTIHSGFAQNDAKATKGTELPGVATIKANLAQQFVRRDFAKLWTKTTNDCVYGCIGDQYQRIRVKFISVNKMPGTNIYTAAGKSMVKTNICDFKGTIAIINIAK
jgi:hypothetical protein